MKIDSSYSSDDKGVFRQRSFLTARTVDDIIALKTRWSQTSKNDREILTAIAEAVQETPVQVALRLRPHLSEEGAEKFIYRVFCKFKKGLVECDRTSFYIIFEAMFN